MTPQQALAHDAWRAWHPTELASCLSGVSRPWCIVGGWALDLWHGYQTRDHEDLEFTILREDLATFRQALKGLEFYTAGDGIVEYLPTDAAPPATISQIWCQDVEQRCWRVDMMIEPGSPDSWVYKRDLAIARPRAEMVNMTSGGLPYLKPAAILLFKAKHMRSKDEIDFEKAVPKLEASERAWLKACLEITHPGHEWAQAL
ncbi:amino acid transporter [Mesorhizobium sp. CGMCC 1.15528]|uniref:Amino acid transporter n=1 Tax=Mesorhizobium zhangyense TaxID=1776730 RepID=A0A7C9R6D4_9HYPH|nr:amino acid transporter [Mesorhizobium zhangyense]NGN40718.1 amino acid transporter [Mesorhizobium zhangyense]